MQVNVAGLRRNIKNLAHNYSDAQVKVREATSNDPWGPSATIMAEIADLTFNVVAFSEIMQMIWKRLNDHGKNWRHVYKALILLEYLIKTGSEKVAQQCKENIFAIQTLREFVYFEEGKDQGTHVREKAKQLAILLRDDERLKNERIKALKAKERFAQHPSGFGSDGYIDGPSQREMPPGWQEEPKAVSELEMVRPQTAGEEELQLQLAMAMSREEAEQEEAKRRSDDVRLQLALSQSEQDFKEQTSRPHENREPVSHLLDFLDISLGAASISNSSGAVGGMPTDPWGTPARAANQLSESWSGKSVPTNASWQPTATAPQTSPSLGTVTGTLNGVSASSVDGRGVGVIGEPSSLTLDPWLSKTKSAMINAPLASSNNVVDPWVQDKDENNVLGKPTNNLDDPWKPNSEIIEDSWKASETVGNQKMKTPDLDEFDIICNRSRTVDAHTYNANSERPPTNILNNNNNNDEIDELAPFHAVSTPIVSNGKKQLKTPQAFLGENSALVNLDNLIKRIPQAQHGTASFNPFNDTIVPPKTNLFQQNQATVLSINQLKQQQPFAMTINQDPWAPVVNSANTTAQKNNNNPEAVISNPFLS